jgi:hypothetical protein
MPSLQELQRGRSLFAAAQPRMSSTHDEERIVTDQRCEMSPAQCVEEKLLRLLQHGENLLRSSVSPRRPR